MALDFAFTGECSPMVKHSNIDANCICSGCFQALDAGRHPHEPLRCRSLDPYDLVSEKIGFAFTAQERCCDG